MRGGTCGVTDLESVLIPEVEYSSIGRTLDAAL